MKGWQAVALWCWWLPCIALAQVSPALEPQQEVLPVPLLWSQGSHVDIVSAIACSPDGRWIASATARGDQGLQPVVHVWNAPTGRYVASFNTDQRRYFGNICALLFSPDSRYLAVAMEQLRLPVYDLLTFRTQVEHSLSGCSLSSDRYGQRLAVGGDGTVSVVAGFSTRTWQVIPSGREWVCVWMTPDGDHLAVAAGTRVQLWRVEEQSLVWEQTMPTRAQSVMGLPLASVLAVGRDDGVVSLFRLSDGQPVAELPPPSQTFGFVHCVAFSPTGTLLASAMGNTLRLWRTTDYALVSEFALRAWAGYGATPQATSLAWSRGSTSVLVGFSDGEIREYAVPGGQLLRWIARKVQPLGYDRASYRLAVRYRGQTEIWDSASGRVLQVVPHTGILSPDWRWLAQVSTDRVLIRRFPEGAEVRTIQERSRNYFESGTAFSPDSRYLLVSSRAGGATAQLYRTDTWQLIWQADGEQPVQWSPRGTFFVTSCEPIVGEPQLVVRRTGDRAEMLRVPALMRALVFSPDERWLAAVHIGSRVDVYRTSDWSQQWQFLTGAMSSYPLHWRADFSRDGRYLLWYNMDRVTVYDAATGSVVNDTIEVASLIDARFTPEGSAILLHSSGPAGTGIVFVPIQWVLNPYYTAYTGAHFGDSLASAGRGWFSPDGKLYLYQREDGTLRMLANPFARQARPRPR